MGMSLVAHARFVPLHPHDKYLTFIVNGMRFDENNPYIIRECIVQVLYACSSCPHKCPFPRRTRRSPNHLPRVVDVQSSAKVPPGSTPRFCIPVALLHRNARTPRGPFEYPTTSPALLIAVASLEVSPGNVPRLRTLPTFVHRTARSPLAVSAVPTTSFESLMSRALLSLPPDRVPRFCTPAPAVHRKAFTPFGPEE